MQATRLPAVYGWREHVVAGGLLCYAPDLAVTFRNAAKYVDKILKGARPADLPVEQVNKFELVINLRTAKTLGLSGQEIFEITGVAEPLNAGELPRHATVNAGNVEFQARIRIDTPKEAEYFRHGGILPYVLRQLVKGSAGAA